jgi:elongator complex protein 3
VRCREVGLRRRAFAEDELRFQRQGYDASGGREEFLSYELDDESLVAYARLRSCSTGAYLRELKVFGQVVPLAAPPTSDWQHRGFGGRLLEACEAIARDEWGECVLRVTSGVGVREYYRQNARKRGHTAFMDGPYVALAV